MTGSADQTRTKSVYERQWNQFPIVRDAEDRSTFETRTGWPLADLAGLTVLDAGCGMGRYLRLVAESGATCWGVDLSGAVRAARSVVGPRPNSAVARADLYRLPFSPGAFDRIYSIGVLDHTPDPKAAFLALAKLLRPGGRIAIWVYRRERPALERVIDAHRAISTRLPLGVLMRFSRWTAPIGGWKRRLLFSRNALAQRFGVALNLLTIGVSMHPDPEVRVCDTFDWYAPKYMSRHPLEEILGWFREAGLAEVRDLAAEATLFHQGQGNGINVSGRRPLDKDVV